jgi:hypothetical protein
MKTEIKIHYLFEEMFNSNIFDKDDLWESLLCYGFSPNELEYLEKIKNESVIDLSGISEATLLEVFKDYFHRHGFFDFEFDNLEDGWRYATVELFYNQELDLGYVFLTNDNEVLLFEGFSSGEEIYENQIS